MPEHIPEATSEARNLRIRRIAATILATVLLGALGSGVWDLLFRPGLREAGGFITRVSTAADDAVFSTAALDPRLVPDLLFLQLIVQVPLWIAMWILMDLLLKPSLLKRVDVTRARNDQTYRNKMLGRMRWGLFGISVFMLASYGLGQIGFSIANKSVLVWRVFHRNLTILGPQLSSEQERKFLADFGNMQRRADYDAVRGQMDALARRNGVELKWQE